MPNKLTRNSQTSNATSLLIPFKWKGPSFVQVQFKLRNLCKCALLEIRIINPFDACLGNVMDTGCTEVDLWNLLEGLGKEMRYTLVTVKIATVQVSQFLKEMSRVCPVWFINNSFEKNHWRISDGQKFWATVFHVEHGERAFWVKSH